VDTELNYRGPPRVISDPQDHKKGIGGRGKSQKANRITALLREGGNSKRRKRRGVEKCNSGKGETLG